MASKLKWSPDGPVSTFTGPSSPEGVLHWLRERHAIEKGETCSDPVIKAARFCRTRRQDDRGTRWLHENWLTPNRDDPDAVWFLSVIFRLCVNEGRVCREISLPLPWDGARYLS